MSYRVFIVILYVLAKRTAVCIKECFIFQFLFSIVIQRFCVNIAEMPLRRVEKSGKIGRTFPDFHF